MDDYRRSRVEDESPVAAVRVAEGHERTDRDYPLSVHYGGQSFSRLSSIPRSSSARLETDPVRQGVDFSQALFVDTETSGLSVGTGTFAFLIGFGRLDGESFRVTQFRLRSPSRETEMLEDVAAFVGEAPEIVSYNGRGFDLQLLQNRFSMNGMPNPFAKSLHLDLLPLARRLFAPRHGNAKLIHLEKKVLEIKRDDDIPSEQVPAIFRESLHNGDDVEVESAMESVLSHHLYDIRTLAALSLEAASRMEDGWDTDDGEDLYGVGDHFWKREEREAATPLFERALVAGLSGRYGDRCLLRLGEQRWREGDREAAMAHWQQVRAADTREYLRALEWFVKFEAQCREDFDRALAHTRDALDRLTRAQSAQECGDTLPDQFFGRTPPRAKETVLRLRDEWKDREIRLPQQRDRCFLRRGEERKREGDWPAALALWEQVEVADTREYLAVLECVAKYQEHQLRDFERALAQVRAARERLGRIPDSSEEWLGRRRAEWEHRATRLRTRISRRTAARDGGNGSAIGRSTAPDRREDRDQVAHLENGAAGPEAVVHGDADGNGEGRTAPDEFVPDGGSNRRLFRPIPDPPQNPAPGASPR